MYLDSADQIMAVEEEAESCYVITNGHSAGGAEAGSHMAQNERHIDFHKYC